MTLHSGFRHKARRRAYSEVNMRNRRIKEAAKKKILTKIRKVATHFGRYIPGSGRPFDVSYHFYTAPNPGLYLYTDKDLTYAHYVEYRGGKKKEMRVFEQKRGEKLERYNPGKWEDKLNLLYQAYVEEMSQEELKLKEAEQAENDAQERHERLRWADYDDL